MSTPLADKPYLKKYWGPATNLRINSNVVGTETPTVVSGKVSIVVYANDGDVATAIVTAGTATATGYATASPGSPVELDVTVGGTITVENTGTPFAVNVIQADNDNAVNLGPIITAGATAASDETVYVFDSANSSDSDSAWYLEVALDGAQNIIDDFLSVVGVNFELTDGTETATLGWTAGTTHQVGIAYGTAGVNQMALNVDGMWSADENYDGTILAGILDLFRSGTFPGKMRELKRFDAADFDAAKAIINTEMIQTLTMTAGTQGPSQGYETAAYGTLVPDTAFTYTINELSEQTGDITLIVNGIVAQSIFETILLDGVTLVMLAADTFVTGGGVSTWTFDSTGIDLVNTTVYPVEVKTP